MSLYKIKDIEITNTDEDKSLTIDGIKIQFSDTLNNDNIVVYKSYIDTYIEEKCETIVKYNSNTNGIKIWCGKVLTNAGNGFFNVDYTDAGFSTPPSVFVTSYSKNDISDTSANNANWACLFKNSVTTNGCKGRAKTADSAGLLAAMVAVNSGDTIEIEILAIGI